MSSSDPYATWSFGFYGGGCYVPSSVTVTPGQIPAQWFNFGASGSVIGGVSTGQTSLGWAEGGTAACSRVVPGDEVEAYETGSTPAQIKFFRWSAPTGPCAITGKNLGPSGAGNWVGPSTVTTNGQFPRLAGGNQGLWLLSGDNASASGVPTAVDVRRYDVFSHSFDPAVRVASVNNPSGLNPDAGGLGENFDSGELAVVWPDVRGDDGQLSLFIGWRGGQFSGAQDIARVGAGYAGSGNARVAVAHNGTGFVTWQQDSGLQVADLVPLATPYKRLLVHHPLTLELPVTCEAVRNDCKASAKVRHGSSPLGHGHRSIINGKTAILRVPLNATAAGLLKAAGGHLNATLRLTITHPGATTTRLIAHTLILR